MRILTEEQHAAKRLYNSEWRKANAARVSEYAKKWRDSNPDKAAAHHATYYANNKEGVKAKTAKYQSDNPEKKARWSARYVLANPEAMAASRKKRASDPAEKARLAMWQRLNPEKVAARNSKWKKENPSKVNASTVRRQATKINATPVWAENFIIDEIYSLATLRRSATGLDWHVDHIVPLRSKLVCGLHVEHNLQVILGAENCRKSNLHWPQMPEAV